MSATVDAENYCYTSADWSRIVDSGETEGNVIVRTKSHELELSGAFWAMREYPHVSYQLRIDEKNLLAFVRTPPRTLADERDDEGRRFQILRMTRII